MPFPNLEGREPAYTDEDARKKLIEYYEIKVEQGGKVPTAEGLANYMGISSDTVQNYLKKTDEYKQFIVSYRIIMNIQADTIIQGGLKNEYNANIAKLMLFNHGYTDKTQVDQKIKAEIETKSDVTLTVEEKLEKALTDLKTINDYD